MEVFDFKQIDTLSVGIYHFDFGNMSPFQTALVNTKLNAITEQQKNDEWPIGDFIYFIYKLNIPFALSGRKPKGMNESEFQRLYSQEFMPFYIKCIKAGIIKTR